MFPSWEIKCTSAGWYSFPKTLYICRYDMLFAYDTTHHDIFAFHSNICETKVYSRQTDISMKIERAPKLVSSFELPLKVQLCNQDQGHQWRSEPFHLSLCRDRNCLVFASLFSLFCLYVSSGTCLLVSCFSSEVSNKPFAHYPASQTSAYALKSCQ